MHVILDQDRWETGKDKTLGQVLADLSERAHARARLVTSLSLDQRTLTDRDLDEVLLAESVTKFSSLTAISQSMQDIVYAARHNVTRYRDMVRQEGNRVADRLRHGDQSLSSLDAWLGQLADCLELSEGTRSNAPDGDPPQSLAPWVHEFLTARTARDSVRMADLLEYEILPRLAA